MHCNGKMALGIFHCQDHFKRKCHFHFLIHRAMHYCWKHGCPITFWKSSQKSQRAMKSSTAGLSMLKEGTLQM